ncbi:MAG: pyruvate kinase [Bacilli bacterium]|nr:pyruvate kinase [Bacilli bacterium]
MKKTKIIASIGPASNDIKVFENMVKNGVNVARINFSHATIEERKKAVDTIVKVRDKLNENVGILYDTKGPEFRNGMLENDSIVLEEGKTIKIVKEDVLGNNERFSVNYPKVLDDLKVKDVILLENGLMKMEVIEKNEDFVNCKIISGGVLGNKKSLNVPNVKLNIPFISSIDYEDIVYACQNKADFIALSFVSSKEDVLSVRKILKEQNREDIKLISKIESMTGIDNIDEIIDESDGIMVARGDLGVEVKMTKLPIYQKIIIEKCREKGKICVVATEMLESMKKNLRPTRAEVSDVANAVLDGTDAVMLSGETTVGKFPVEVVRYMAGICEHTENYYDYDYVFENKRKRDTTEAIAESVVSCSETIGTKAIVACTTSGYSAKKISNLKPKNVIIATCPSENVVRSLALSWGVYPVLVPLYKSTDEIVESARNKAIEELNLKNGDNIVITGGFHIENKERTTNFLKIEQI